MTSTKGGLIANKTNQAAQTPQASALSVAIASDGVKKRFNEMLGKKSAGFLSSLLTLANNNTLLKNADYRTILAAAATAASLDLPINPSLGMAYVVPFKGSAQFQMGWKGYVNLAQRSGQVKKIISTPVYEGEIQDWNRFTEEYKAGEKISNEVIGYFACFELINGFRKCTFWTKDEVIEHAKKFSQTYKRGTGAWATNFDAMACKTVLLNIIKYAPLSIEMQMALENDGMVKSLDENGATIDIEMGDDSVDFETGEVIEAEEAMANEQQS